VSEERRAAEVVRLQKALADRGVASRRRAEALITGGRVRVDGEAVMTLGTKVPPDARIDVDGVPTRQAVPRYVLLNKPKGVVSTANDERGRKTVVQLIGAQERLYPVGRLDTDSEGALLLTNDGDWAERVLHPRYGHEREYDVTVSGPVTSETIAQLRNGIRLEEGLAVAVRVDVQSRSRDASRIRMVLHTGWRRQVRRMLSVVGLRTVRLVRVRVGDLELGKLKAGEWRDLTPKEIADLAKPAEAPRKPGRRAAARLAAAPKVAAPRSAPAPVGTLGVSASASAARAPRIAAAQRAQSARRPSLSPPSARAASAPPPRRSPSPGRPPIGGRAPVAGRRPPQTSRAPTRRLPSLARPVVRRGSAPTGPRRPQARGPQPRGPQRFGRRPLPQYGTSRGPVRAKITPR
jgi:23S rRNA pseudouridine2605 synthase